MKNCLEETKYALFLFLLFLFPVHSNLKKILIISLIMWTKRKVTFFLKNRPCMLHKVEETKSKISIENWKYTYRNVIWNSTKTDVILALDPAYRVTLKCRTMSVYSTRLEDFRFPDNVEIPKITKKSPIYQKDNYFSTLVESN